MQSNQIEQLRQRLMVLAKERHKESPLRVYPNREKFEQALNEFADLVIQSANQESREVDPEIERTCEHFKNKPVFIAGFFKSGTSMLNSLFDFHPKVVALLPEPDVFFCLFPKANLKDKESFFDFLAKKYLKMIYNPNGHFPMNLYNQGKIDILEIAPYVKFVSYLKYFIFRAQNRADLISALAQAVFLSNGQKERGDLPKIWVEKTPRSERGFQRAQQLFPEVKFIYILRNPFDNLASLRRWYLSSGRPKMANLYFHFYGLKKSYQKALALSKQNNFLIVKYEDLVLKPKEYLPQVCAYLGLDYIESLLRPSASGLPDRPNISDQTDENKDVLGKIIASRVKSYQSALNQKEIKEIALFFRKELKIFNYVLEKEAKSDFFSLLLIWFKVVLQKWLAKIQELFSFFSKAFAIFF